MYLISGGEMNHCHLKNKSAVKRLHSLLLAVFITACFLSCSCRGEKVDGKNEILLVTYNTQTFFDSTNAGTEFKEFRNSEWTDEMYRNRLKRLAGILASASGSGGNRIPEKPPFPGFISFQETFFSGKTDKKNFPEIIVLQEIENVEVLKDLCAFFPVQDIYSHIVFIPAGNGSAFSTAVLSVYPAERVTAHDFSNLDRLKDKPSLRPLTEIIFNTGRGKLALYAVHWKSKSGAKLQAGNQETRNEQEKVLYNRIRQLKKEKPEIPFIVCGDFNQQPEEFRLMDEYDSAWDYLPEQAGTYFFRGKWEKIDNIFVSDHFIKGLSGGKNYFFIVNNPCLLKRDGSPYGFKLYTGKGYSDHLPLAFRFVLPDTGG